NSIMRRYMHVPQIAAVMGQCIAGGAYLPVLSDVILMVKGTSFMGLGGPNLVKGATGEVVDSETLGGAITHTEISGVAHYALDHDASCIAKIRDLVERLPDGSPASSPDQATRTKSAAKSSSNSSAKSSTKSSSGSSAKSSSKRDAGAERLYDLLPADHRMSYDMHPVLSAILDDGKL